MTDIVERLREYALNEDHERGCQGREYSCTCGYDDKRDPLLTEAADTITTLRAEVERLKARDAEWLDVGTDAHGVITRMKAELTTLRAEVGKLLAALCADEQTLRLHLGEMTAQEMRTVKAGFKWVLARAALGEEKK